MPRQKKRSEAGLADFRIDGRMMRYSVFMPRLFNYCRALGFRPERMLPSRAFCSDESQGYPVILIAKHFGTFPFNHGRVGGIVATDRHGPHAEHGEDLVILQASHVGYDPETSRFGTYRRLRTHDEECGANCGKIAHVLAWYLDEHDYARSNIRIEYDNGEWFVAIDNALLDSNRREGLFLNLDRIAGPATNGSAEPVRILSTSRVFRASSDLSARLPAGTRALAPIGDTLTAEMFYFLRPIADNPEGDDQIERNLQPLMPAIVTAQHPMLAAAQANTRVEFDRAYRSLVHSPHYQGKNLLFVSGLNIDISPVHGQPFPLTKFVPWAAFVQQRDGSRAILEQDELWTSLSAQGEDNPAGMDLEAAISEMGQAAEVRVRTD